MNFIYIDVRIHIITRYVCIGQAVRRAEALDAELRRAKMLSSEAFGERDESVCSLTPPPHSPPRTTTGP